MGYLTRRFGLTVDNLVSADVQRLDRADHHPARSPVPHRDLGSQVVRHPAGLQGYWRSDFFRKISDDAIKVHHKFGEMLPTGQSTMHMYPIDGAAARVPDDATPFACRDGGWAGVIVGVDADPANAGLITNWAKDYWAELHPTSATTTGWRRSKPSTTRTTCSTSTRTSRRRARRGATRHDRLKTWRLSSARWCEARSSTHSDRRHPQHSGRWKPQPNREIGEPRQSRTQRRAGVLSVLRLSQTGQHRDMTRTPYRGIGRQT